MSRKRRFRRKALARLEMFFSCRPYTGFRSSVKDHIVTEIIGLASTKSTKLAHHKYVTKKAIYNADYTIC